MSVTRRTFCKSLVALASVPAWAASGQAWPVKPVILLVPGGAGGVTDIRARWLAPRLAAVLGQPVVVENKPGAGGLIGMEAAAKAPKDGYTLVINHQGVIAMNPHLYPHLPYDALADYTPITRLGMGPLALVCNPALGVKDLKGFIALAKSRATPLAFGSPGVGTPPHIAAMMLVRKAGIEALHVPYRGGGQAASDLIAGHVDFSVEGLNVMVPHVLGGRLKGLGTTGASRVAVMPDVPTIEEAGLPGYRFDGWVGLAGPAGLPGPILSTIHSAVAKVLASQEAHEFFTASGADATPISPAEFRAFIREEHAHWGSVIRDLGIKADA